MKDTKENNAGGEDARAEIRISITETERQCSMCDFWVPGPDLGSCRKNAPIGGSVSYKWEWPLTKPEEWCSFFRSTDTTAERSPCD